MRDCDFEKLDQCIPFLIRSSFGNLLSVRILDPAIAKIYIISQLSLQYLLFCTKFLDKSVYTLRENIFDYQKKCLKLEETAARRDEEIQQLHKKLQRQEALSQPIFPCTKCLKNFISAELLNFHVIRRHSGETAQESKDKDTHLINTIKLELEVKQLKERLNLAEKELMDAKKQNSECKKCQLDTERSFRSIGIQSNFDEEKEKDDNEKDQQNIRELLIDQLKHFEELKSNEEIQYRQEINDLKSKLDQTIEMLAQKSDTLIPTTRVIGEKFVGTSKSNEFMDKIQFEPDHENIWKSRYQELEDRMTATIAKMEKAYSKQMKKIEVSVNLLREEKFKVRQVHANIQVEPPRTSQPLADSYTTLQSNYQHEPSTVDDSYSSSEEKDIKNNSVAQSSTVLPGKASSPSVIAQPQTKTFSGQKFQVREKKVQSGKSTIKLKAQELFNQRLQALGISSDTTRLKKEEYSKISADMAALRDKAKEKDKRFFITRKKLIDQIFLRGGSKNVSNNEVVHNPESSKHQTETIIKPFLLDRNDAERISAEVEPTTSKDNLRENLERILQKNVSFTKESVTEHLQPLSRSEHEEGKKKKVLFNLETENNLKRFEGLDDIRELKEDDSDFDVSSFDED